MQWDRLDASHTTNATWPIEGKKVHIYYIHVGKTGGLTLEYRIPIPIKRKQLSFDCVIEEVNRSQSVEDALNACDPQRAGDTAISRQIVAHYHLTAPTYSSEQKDWSLKLTNTILFTIRNPIDRIISAFHFQYNRGYVAKPKPREHYRTRDAGAIFYIDCFPNASLSTAIEALQTDSHTQQQQQQQLQDRTPISDECRTTAHRAFQGYVAPRLLKPSQRKFPHFLFNYQWYLERYMRSSHKPDVIVIRTSHLWNDTTAVDHALGGGAIPFEQPGSAYTHGSERFRHHANSIQRHHLTTLCCLLHRDLQAYQWIVRMAMNLQRADKEDAIRDLMDTCGVPQQAMDEDSDLLAFLWEDWYYATGCPNLLWAPAD